MKKANLEETHRLKTSFRQAPGRIKIRVTHSPANRKSPKPKNRPEEDPARADLLMVVKAQPAPRIPELTREMVRCHVPRLLAEKILDHAPATLSDWLLAEWHLARELDLPESQLACFSSATTRHPVRQATASFPPSTH